MRARHRPKGLFTIDEVADDILRVLARAQAGEEWGCVLCNKPTTTRALFIPGNSQSFGAPAGVDRAFTYALCNDHDLSDPLTAERAEVAIRSKLGLN